jgi:Uncharacterized protein conserved in bacteria
MGRRKSGVTKKTNAFTIARAKEMRRCMTYPEAVLWQQLSANKMGVHFRRQHPIGRFIADFYCHQYSLVIEVDGKIHEEEERMEHDKVRTMELKQMGLSVIRFTNERVIDDTYGVIDEIREYLRLRSLGRR